MGIIDNFEKMLGQGQDNVMLRFGLGNAYLQEKRFAEAALHLQQAVTFDPKYSAAWKLLGTALIGAGRANEAAEAYQRGIAVAEEKGDLQAAKEMRVFLKRLQRE